MSIEASERELGETIARNQAALLEVLTEILEVQRALLKEVSGLRRDSTEGFPLPSEDRLG